MRFMVIVKGGEDYEGGAMPSEAELAEMGKFNEELVNAGEAAVRLTSPVSIAVGPQRARAEPFELRPALRVVQA